MEKKIVNVCGCVKENCSFGSCRGNGHMSIAMIIPAGYEKIDRVSAIFRDEYGNHFMKRFCLTAEDWVTEPINLNDLQVILAG